MDKNIAFLKHYSKLDAKFSDPNQCYTHYINESNTIIEGKIKVNYEADANSILGTYYRINPELKSPELYHNLICTESTRITITQYRTGSHQLRIQTGRMNNEVRDSRLCGCMTDIQTIDHMLFTCPYTENIRQTHNYINLNLTTFFKCDDYERISDILKSIDAMK